MGIYTENGASVYKAWHVFIKKPDGGSWVQAGHSDSEIAVHKVLRYASGRSSGYYRRVYEVRIVLDGPLEGASTMEDVTSMFQPELII